MSGRVPRTGGSLPAPAGFPRRIGGLVYEALIALAISLAVGVVFVALRGVFAADAPMRITGPARVSLQAVVLIALGVYFVWAWHQGQTLAMRTWRLRLVAADGRRASYFRAGARFVVAATIYGVAFAGTLYLREHATAVEAWFALVPLALTLAWPLWDRERQFLHDRVAGTRLVRDTA